MAKITMNSGVVYEDVLVGEGPVFAAGKGDRVLIHYTYASKEGRVYDASDREGPGFEFHFDVGHVIKGLELGMAGMKEGGKRKLYVPSKLAFGTRGAGRIVPSNADLVVDVEYLGWKAR